MDKITGYIYYDTFMFQATEYPMNTVVKFKKDIWRNNKLLCKYPFVQLVESYLDHGGTHRWTYALWTYSGNIISYRTSRTPDEVLESIIEIVNPPPHAEKTEYYKDSEVNGMLTGWLIYIAVMFGGIIFRDVIIIWVVATIYFFIWRKEKLKKPVKYVYGVDIYKKVREWND